jgi:hypothetical protein
MCLAPHFGCRPVSVSPKASDNLGTGSVLLSETAHEVVKLPVDEEEASLSSMPARAF